MSIFDSPLIQDQLEKCVILNKAIVSDGYGGYRVTYTEGAEFDAIITENSSVEAQVAAVTTEKTFYGIKTRRNVPLEYNTVFRRASGETYRITASQAMDSPSFSAMDMKALTAEEFTLVEEGETNG